MQTKKAMTKTRYDLLVEVEKSVDVIQEVEKFNPYHGSDGRFTSAGAATSFTYAPGKSKAHDLAIAREKARFESENNPYGFKRITGNHSPEDDAKNTNPNYNGGGKAYRDNCQRCVPAYEMRRRGYDVVAKPTTGNDDSIKRAWHSIFKGQTNYTCYEGSGKAEVEAKMAEWGDGARAEVYVAWKYGGAHVFVAERIKGKTHFIDPQVGDADCSSYFKSAKEGRTKLARLDNLEPKLDKIQGCCE